MNDRSERPASRGTRKRGFLILTSAFAAVARIDGAEAQDAEGGSERRLFHFFPDGDNAIGLGAATLSRRR